MNENYRAYKAAREAALNCAGWRIEALRERLRYSYYAFHENWRELDAWLDWATGPKGRVIATISFFQPEPRFWFMRELERRLHNFCAGAKSLVDHTRVVHDGLVQYRDVADTVAELIKSRFATDGRTQFILKLRNYLLHYGPVSAQYGLEWRMGDLSVPFSFRKELLLQWDGWNAVAREFIEQTADALPIRATVADYHGYVKSFYDILYDKHEEWFAAEYSEMDRLFSEGIARERKLDEEKT